MSREEEDSVEVRTDVNSDDRGRSRRVKRNCGEMIVT